MSMTMNILPPLMRLNQTYKTVTWLTIALYTLLAVNSFAGQVLCVGDDSHMQLESTAAFPSSIEIPHLESSVQLGDSQGHPGCGICSDVDLDLAGSTRILSRPVNVPIPALLVGPAWSNTAIPSTNFLIKQAYLDKRSPVETQQKLSVSTVILLC